MKFQKNKIRIPREVLTKFYKKKKMTTYQIADIFNCNAETVRRRMIEHGIKRRKGGKRRFDVSRKELKELYWNKKLSTVDIGRKYGCSSSTVREWLLKFGIKTRIPPEGIRMACGLNFSPEARAEFSVKEKRRIILEMARKMDQAGDRVEKFEH